MTACRRWRARDRSRPDPKGPGRRPPMWVVVSARKARYLKPVRMQSPQTRSDAKPARAARAFAAAQASAVAMTQDEERELREQLARLQQEHRDLDAAISALQHSPGSDLLQVQRLKKRKLYLRDRISFIEDQLTPDIIA
jgi:hypothetical protein